MEVMVGVARINLQKEYTGLKKSLKQEWDFSSVSPQDSGGTFVLWRRTSRDPSSQTFYTVRLTVS